MRIIRPPNSPVRAAASCESLFTMNKRYILTALVLFLSLTGIAAGQRVRRSFEFGFVKSGYDWAGEQIWPATSKKSDRIPSKAAAFLGADSTGKINIDGNDIELKFVKGRLPVGNQKAGRGGYQLWRGRNVTLRIDYIFTQKCPVDDECFTYYFNGVMAVTYRGRLRRINIRGFGSS